jgi:hypothetical protein
VCNCRSLPEQFRCSLCRGIAEAARELMNLNRLTAAAKSFDVSDADWCLLVQELGENDLHLLLEEQP